MKKIIVIPDSFKGTMTSIEVCRIMADEILRHDPDCEVITIPVADGGEGTVDCLLSAIPGEKVNTVVQDAYGGLIQGFYGRFEDTAIIEMAAVAGMVSNTKRDTINASTFGVGQLISHAIDHGASRIIIGLGGSCTSDAGCGMASALGMKFYNGDGGAFIPVGSTLSEVRSMDGQQLKKKLRSVEIYCMCDTNKVMYGSDGAAYVYAPQKGASPEDVILLDHNLRQLALTIEKELGVKVAEIPGGGAAGAMGAGAVAFMGAELKSGIEYIMDMVGFQDALNGADFVITGEGSFDMQSFSGKAVFGIAGRATAQNVPVIVVTGRNMNGSHDLTAYGIAAVYETAHTSDFEEIRRTCREDLRSTMDRVLGEIDQVLSK